VAPVVLPWPEPESLPPLLVRDARDGFEECRVWGSSSKYYGPVFHRDAYDRAIEISRMP
jgi:hypothetical protein